MNIEGLLRRLILLVLFFMGGLLMFIGKIIALYATLNVREGALLVTFGAFTIAAASLVWAIASKRTTDYQNLGLLIMAGILLAAFGMVI